MDTLASMNTCQCGVCLFGAATISHNNSQSHMLSSCVSVHFGNRRPPNFYLRRGHWLGKLFIDNFHKFVNAACKLSVDGVAWRPEYRKCRRGRIWFVIVFASDRDFGESIAASASHSNAKLMPNKMANEIKYFCFPFFSLLFAHRESDILRDSSRNRNYLNSKKWWHLSGKLCYSMRNGTKHPIDSMITNDILISLDREYCATHAV